jgi:hypothetical protein
MRSVVVFLTSLGFQTNPTPQGKSRKETWDSELLGGLLMDEEICMRRFSCLDKKETSLGFQRSSSPTPMGEKIEGRERECVCVWRRENPCNRGKRLLCGLFCFWSRAIRFSKVGVQGKWKNCGGFARFVKIFFWVLFGHLEEVIILTRKERAPTAAAGTFLFGLPLRSFFSFVCFLASHAENSLFFRDMCMLLWTYLWSCCDEFYTFEDIKICHDKLEYLPIVYIYLDRENSTLLWWNSNMCKSCVGELCCWPVFLWRTVLLHA